MEKSSRNVFLEIFRLVFIQKKTLPKKNSIQKKIIISIADRLPNRLSLLGNFRKSGGGFLPLLLDEIQVLFKTKKDIVKSDLINDFWKNMFPERSFFSFLSIFIFVNFQKKKKEGFLTDPFLKLFYGILLLIYQKESKQCPGWPLNRKFKFFSDSLTKKSEQELSMMSFLSEHFFENDLDNFTSLHLKFFLFMDRHKCCAPVVLGKFLCKLISLKRNHIFFWSSGQFLINSKFSNLRGQLPLNFFFIESLQLRKISPSIYYLIKNKKILKEFILKSKISSQTNNLALRFKKDNINYFTKKKFSQDFFTFWWKLKQDIIFPSNKKKILREKFSPIGIKINDPFGDLKSLSRKSGNSYTIEIFLNS